MIQDTIIATRMIVDGRSREDGDIRPVTTGSTEDRAVGLPEKPWGVSPFSKEGCKPEVPAQPSRTEAAVEKMTALVERMMGEFTKVIDKAFEAINKLTEKVSELISSKPNSTAQTGPATKSESSETAARNLGKTGEFLWKPTSEKDGKLAVLLPSQMTGKVKSVKILDAKGEKTLATGKHSGVGNGDREHFRFGKAGSQFPKGAIVEIALSDGGKRRVTIEDTAKRTTR